MAKKPINSPKAPAAIGPYSHSYEAGNQIFVSGQIPFKVETGKVISEVFKDQVGQCLENIKHILDEGGYKVTDIVKVGIFVTDLGKFGELNEVYSKFFGDHKPARFAVQVAALPAGVQVEMDAIAIK
jgi:2-iminobutanoate/2-iminopropanoate deaminase